MTLEVKKRLRGVTKVSSQNQITIPVDALRSSGIQAGDRLRVSSTEDGRIVLERHTDPVTALAGILTGELDRSLIEGLRAEWD